MRRGTSGAGLTFGRLSREPLATDAAIQRIDLEGNIPAWNDINVAMNVIVKGLD